MDDVEVAQLGVELDRVEGPRHAVDEHDVGEVQVGMAFAHEALRAARVDQRRLERELTLAPGAQRTDARVAAAFEPGERFAQPAQYAAERPKPGGEGASAP